MAEEDQWEIMHVLKGATDKISQCSEKCGDPVCEYGCLRRDAQQHYRADIMHAIATLRETGSNEFPLNVGAYMEPNHRCTVGNLGIIGSNDKICRDPVCRVTGCLNRPAWRFRKLIKLEQDNKIIKALKKK